MVELESKNKLDLRVKTIGEYIGQTPLYRFDRILPEYRKLFGKLEWQQLGGSVKARPAYQIIKEAVLSGRLTAEKRLLDASSGNTAIAYASIGAKLGLGVTICLPENASEERKKILLGLGAELIYTSRYGGTDDAQEEAQRINKEQPEKYFYADQYNNDANKKAHYLTTSEEIWKQTNGTITHFVTGLGTTGSFSGISKRLKELNPSIKTVSLQPDGPMHGLEGWKHLETARIPGIYEENLVDDNLFIDSAEAYDMIRQVAKKEGLLISPSSAANLIGAIKVMESATEEAVVVTLLPDNAEKYGEVLKMVF